jgi:predicted flap endonuclease-1-like 5' DNA nuclease
VVANAACVQATKALLRAEVVAVAEAEAEAEEAEAEAAEAEAAEAETPGRPTSPAAASAISGIGP